MKRFRDSKSNLRLANDKNLFGMVHDLWNARKTFLGGDAVEKTEGIASLLAGFGTLFSKSLFGAKPHLEASPARDIMQSAEGAIGISLLLTNLTGPVYRILAQKLPAYDWNVIKRAKEHRYTYQIVTKQNKTITDDHTGTTDLEGLYNILKGYSFSSMTTANKTEGGFTYTIEIDPADAVLIKQFWETLQKHELLLNTIGKGLIMAPATSAAASRFLTGGGSSDITLTLDPYQRGQPGSEPKKRSTDIKPGTTPGSEGIYPKKNKPITIEKKR